MHLDVIHITHTHQYTSYNNLQLDKNKTECLLFCTAETVDSDIVFVTSVTLLCSCESCACMLA
jgi:hypothetical protein